MAAWKSENLKSILKPTVCFRKQSAIKYSRFVVSGLKHSKPQVLYDPLSLYNHYAQSTNSAFALVLLAHVGMRFIDHTRNNGISVELLNLI